VPDTLLRILIATRRLTGCTGTEIVTRDLALALRSLGHDVVVYSPLLGDIAQAISAAGVPVHDAIERIALRPDVVHGNHPKPMLDALRRFSHVPAVAVCHDATSVRDEPVFHPRVLRYVAVDQRCRARVERNLRIPRERIEVRPNAVDLGRFRQRPPLPSRPARAVVFSNSASRRTHLPVVRAACRAASLSLDVIGLRAGTATLHPEDALGRYDVVFAKARCALEAMAVGAAVILCDAAGLGVMVTSEDVDRLRRMNFGQGVLTRPLAVRGVLDEIDRYDSADAARVCAWVRREAGLERAARDWVRLYGEVVEDAHRAGPREGEEQAAWDDVADRWRYEVRMDREERHVHMLSAIPLVGRRLEWLVSGLRYRARHWPTGSLRRTRSQP